MVTLADAGLSPRGLAPHRVARGAASPRREVRPIVGFLPPLGVRAADPSPKAVEADESNDGSVAAPGLANERHWHKPQLLREAAKEFRHHHEGADDGERGVAEERVVPHVEPVERVRRLGGEGA